MASKRKAPTNSHLDDKFASLFEAAIGSLNPFSKYRNDPVAFAKEVLSVELWEKQKEVCRALIKYRRVLVRSGNGVGKTLLAAVLAVWFYCCWEKDSECIVTGPRAEQLIGTTFKEIRTLLPRALPVNNGLSPKAPRAENSHDHVLKCTTAKDADAFQGTHPPNCFLLFEEATGVDQEFWEAAKRILVGGNVFHLAIFNPTNSSSAAYNEECSGRFHVLEISAVDHPNVQAELKGLPAPIPSAVRLENLLSNMADWGQFVKEAEAQPDDVVLEPLGKDILYWRPGPLGYSCILGQYPKVSNDGIFNQESLDNAAIDPKLPSSDMTESEAFLSNLLELSKELDPENDGPDRFGKENPIVIGSDIARLGEDKTTITARVGMYMLSHESHAGYDTTQTTDRLIELATEIGETFGVDPRKIPIYVDEAGIGGGCIDQGKKEGFNFIGAHPQKPARNPFRYPDRRSEILFSLSNMYKRGLIKYGTALDRKQIQEIKRQALSIRYVVNQRAQRCAESKNTIRDRVRRSPDDIDSICLCYHGTSGYCEYVPFEASPQKPLMRDDRTLFERERRPPSQAGTDQTRVERSNSRNNGLSIHRLPVDRTRNFHR